MAAPRKYTAEELIERNRSRAREAYRNKRAAEGHAVKPHTRTGSARRSRRERYDDELGRVCAYIEDRARARALRAGVCCTITDQDVRRMWHEQRTACAATGLKMTLSRGHDTYRVAPTRVSIDRICAGGGYTPDNVRLVCWWYNLVRGQYGDEVMLEMARALVQNA